PTKDDECYGIDDLDNTINAEAQELLENDEPDSFLSRGLEKSIDQSDLEGCEPVECKTDNDSGSNEPIRRMASINRPHIHVVPKKGGMIVVLNDNNELIPSCTVTGWRDAKPRLIRWVLLHQGFDIEIKDKRGAENLAADHLLRLENLELSTFTKEEIADEFPDEHLMALKAKINNDEPWYADYVNYLVGKILPPNWTPEKRKSFFSQVKNYFWDEPYVFKLCSDNIMRRCVAGKEIFEILAHCHSGPTGRHHSASVTGRKVYESGFF
ncbi:hypothetical protein Tco_1382105, partial [Tanacetum coccineum]